MNKRYLEIAFDNQREAGIKQFQEAYQTLETKINEIDPSRERSLALTKLEESFLWAIEALKEEQFVFDTLKKNKADREAKEAEEKAGKMSIEVVDDTDD